MIAKTWNRDTHGLFDFETSNFKELSITLKSDYDIIRDSNNIKIVTHNKDKNKDLFTNILCYLKNKNGHYFISCDMKYFMLPNITNINSLDNKLWYIFKNNYNENFTENFELPPLQVGDIIKFGRVKYVINEININNINTNYDTNNELQIFNLCPHIEHILTSINERNEQICKICLFSEAPCGDPNLYKICNCNGSIQNIHIHCLKTWLKTKLQFKESQNTHILWYYSKRFNCEICKKSYPFSFTSNDNKFFLIDIEKPVNSDYLILEGLNQFRDSNTSKVIHVIPLKEGCVLKMGRGNDCDIKINDISVSRNHALLTMKNGNIYLKDLKSKFGTGILIKKETEIKDELLLQLGQTIVKFSKVKEEDINCNNMNTSTDSSHCIDINNAHHCNNSTYNKPLFIVKKTI